MLVSVFSFYYFCFLEDLPENHLEEIGGLLIISSQFSNLVFQVLHALLSAQTYCKYAWSGTFLTQKQHILCPSKERAVTWWRIESHLYVGPYWPYQQYLSWRVEWKSLHLWMKRKTNQKQEYMCVNESMPMELERHWLSTQVYREFTFSLWCNIEENCSTSQANIILLVPI